jgi:hypothetical protein
MNEKGIVTEAADGFVTVKTERLLNNGCGCGTTLENKAFLVRARNLCEAKPGDTVELSSNYYERHERNTFRTAGVFVAFIAGVIIGEIAFGMMNLPFKNTFALALGVLTGLVTMCTVTMRFKKKPLSENAAVAVIPSP